MELQRDSKELPYSLALGMVFYVLKAVQNKVQGVFLMHHKAFSNFKMKNNYNLSIFIEKKIKLKIEVTFISVLNT